MHDKQPLALNIFASPTLHIASYYMYIYFCGT